MKSKLLDKFYMPPEPSRFSSNKVKRKYSAITCLMRLYRNDKPYIKSSLDVLLKEYYVLLADPEQDP